MAYFLVLWSLLHGWTTNAKHRYTINYSMLINLIEDGIYVSVKKAPDCCFTVNNSSASVTWTKAGRNGRGTGVAWQH
jgi:hypothetical protein